MLEHRLQTGIVELNYAEGPPNGPPFIILHGGSGSWRNGETFIELLMPDWRVYAPDLRGHGGSGHVPDRYTLPDYAADIAMFLETVVQAPAVLYGHSLGGEVAIVVAAEHPNLLRALIIGDVPIAIEDHPTEEEPLQAMNILWHSLAGHPVDETDAALRDMPIVASPGAPARRAEDAFGADNPWFAFQAWNLHVLDPGVLATVLEGPAAVRAGCDFDLLLPEITCPVLLLQADPAAGGLLTDEDVAHARALLPNATHIRLTGIGHKLHGPPGQAQRVLDALEPFLDGLPS